MLLHHPCSHGFSEKRLQRLRLLERAVFATLPLEPLPGVRVRDYAEFLAQAGVIESAEKAVSDRGSRRLLERDLRDYAAWCDAFVPAAAGEGSGYRVDLDADRDAIRFFLGEAWLEASLRPKLSSAIARVFLLAREDGQELRFGYRAVRKAGQPWQFRHLTGRPVALVPGSDSAYLRLWNGRSLFHVNLARISLPVERTQTILPDPPSSSRSIEYQLEFDGIEDARALSATFHGISGGGRRLRLTLDAESAVMTLDRLAAYLWRTRDRPGEKAHLTLPGVVVTRLKSDEEEQE